MLKHVQTAHHDFRPFVCPMCQSAFGFKNVLQRHMARCHVDLDKGQAVDRQDDASASNPDDVVEASNMIVEMIMNLTGVQYEDARPFACEHCRFRFRRKYDLDRHQQKCVRCRTENTLCL
jgi:predicted Zn-ribbon and HTH transcriptional regulator